MSEILWIAVAMMLVLEGLLPLLSPGQWRRIFLQITSMTDGQIRFIGLASTGLGLLLFWLLWP